MKQTNIEKLVSLQTITDSEQNFYEICIVHDSLSAKQNWEIDIEMR